MDREDERLVRPDGLAIRGRRHRLAWSPRDLVDAIGHARARESGVRESITPDLLLGIEEENEPIPYATLCLVAAGLDCNPIDILGADPADEPEGDPASASR